MTLFFKSYQKHYTQKQADDCLAEAKRIITDKFSEESSRDLMQLILARERDFRNQIDSQRVVSRDASPESDRRATREAQQPYINAFYVFAKTLNDYFEAPELNPHALHVYTNSPYYLYVGKDSNHSYNSTDSKSKAALYSGILLTLLGLFLIPVNLPAALITIGIGITMLAPSAYYSTVITRSNENAVYAKEEELFAAAKALVASDSVATNDEDESPTETIGLK
ncbi:MULTISPECIES: hypothetical protein [Legionella]|uniref:23, 7 kDa protein n=1 Tax=Legionella drozanskii LLAP-1 TaxID=1212489 RepID=A0A0W0TBS6_9GAMM|nr:MULTISPECIES: hypothetical protein [Legionella]KTC93038.1 23, 7 kDa protein [Legionella drozanskii LLAP-1]PJE11943.1 MAG: hypothetical protein CK430_08215 [Legionella sp.]